MPPLDRLLWRLLVAALGFLAAVIASLVVVAVSAVVAPFLHAAVVDAPPISLGALLRAWYGLELSTVLVQAIWPGWLIVALLGEIVALRSLLALLAAFAAVAIVSVFGVLPAVPPLELRYALAAALVAGFVHWLVAGRSAGFALRPTQDDGKGDPRSPHA